MKYLPLILRNLGRNKLRRALTGAAIVLAVVLVCFLLTMPAGLNVILAQTANNVRISVHHKAGIVYPMPFAFVHKVRTVPGVVGADEETWFGGAFDEAGHVTFPNFAVEPEHVGACVAGLPHRADAARDSSATATGAIVGQQTMRKYGWKIGQRITLRSTVWPVTLDVPHRRRDRQPRRRSSGSTASTSTRRLKRRPATALGIAGMIWVRAADPAPVNGIMREIDDDVAQQRRPRPPCETEKPSSRTSSARCRGSSPSS